MLGKSVLWKKENINYIIRDLYVATTALPGILARCLHICLRANMGWRTDMPRKSEATTF